MFACWIKHRHNIERGDDDDDDDGDDDDGDDNDESTPLNSSLYRALDSHDTDDEFDKYTFKKVFIFQKLLWNVNCLSQFQHSHLMLNVFQPRCWWYNDGVSWPDSVVIF